MLSERVTVLQNGDYLGPDRKAVTAAAGDVVTVLGGWYAAALVEGGLAGYTPETEAPTSASSVEPAQPAADPDMTVRVDLAAMAKPRKPARGSRT